MRFLSVQSFIYFLNFIISLGYKPYGFALEDIRASFKSSGTYISQLCVYVDFRGNAIQISFYEATGVIKRTFVLERI